MCNPGHGRQLESSVADSELTKVDLAGRASLGMMGGGGSAEGGEWLRQITCLREDF